MHVAITGASSGIGEAIARELARAGASVTLVARRRDALERIAAELGTRTFVAVQDLSDTEHAADWVAPAEAALGPIDVLVSNAGFLVLGPVAGFDPDEVERTMKVNLLAPARIIRAVLPGMLARKAGVIVNVTSSPRWWPSRAGCTRRRARPAAPSSPRRCASSCTGVHVVTVYPGMTDTPMAQGGLELYGRKGLAARIPLGDAAVLAGRLRRAIQRRRARLVYPRFYTLVRWFPRVSRWLAERFAPRLPHKA